MGRNLTDQCGSRSGISGHRECKYRAVKKQLFNYSAYKFCRLVNKLLLCCCCFFLKTQRNNNRNKIGTGYLVYLWPLYPAIHWHCPVIWSHIPPLRHEHSLLQLIPYLPNGHGWAHTDPCSERRQRTFENQMKVIHDH